jgi:hypothetical protein
MKLIFIHQNNNNNILELCYIFKSSNDLKKWPKTSKIGYKKKKKRRKEGTKHQNRLTLIANF